MIIWLALIKLYKHYMMFLLYKKNNIFSILKYQFCIRNLKNTQHIFKES